MSRLLVPVSLLAASAASAQTLPSTRAASRLPSDVANDAQEPPVETVSVAPGVDAGVSAAGAAGGEYELALPAEAGVYVASGSVGVRATAPILLRSLGSNSARGLNATGILGASRAVAGLFAVAGTASGGNFLRASAGVGVWAETSPGGRALGLVVEAHLRAFVSRVDVGLVPVGETAQRARAGIDLPIAAVIAYLYLGVTAEAQHFSDTGETLRSVGFSLSLWRAAA